MHSTTSRWGKGGAAVACLFVSRLMNENYRRRQPPRGLGYIENKANLVPKKPAGEGKLSRITTLSDSFDACN